MKKSKRKAAEKAVKKPMRIPHLAVTQMSAPVQALRPFTMPTPPPGVLPAGESGMAMDSNVTATNNWAMAQAAANANLFSAVGGFIGYSYLSELAQLPEYRLIAEKIAMSMTRNWIRLQATGDGKKDEGKAQKLQALEAAMRRYGVQDLFREAAEQDGFFGLSHLYIDTGASRDSALLQTPLVVDQNTIPKGALRGFRLVEPVWTYPNEYNSSNPLVPEYYRPQSWFVMGEIVHSSRLLTFVGRKVPDLLKPSYNFGGMSLTQMAMPYVNNWIRTRTSVGDLVHNFSVMQLATNLASMLEDAGGEQLLARAQLFNQTRDNRGLMLTDKESEELHNVAVPLSSLDKLQAQAQEQMASVSSIPLVVLLGTTPAGLNASTDGEIRAFYDWVKACQERLFTAPLKTVMDVIQLSEFGEIDPEIGFEFEPLWQLDDVARATERKTNADTAAVYISSGVIDPGEERERLATDDESLYPSLDLNKEIEAPGLEVPEDIEGDPARGEGGGSEEREI